MTNQSTDYKEPQPWLMVAAYLLLNAASGYEPVDINLLLLPITPYPGSCLLVCGRIPVCTATPAVTLLVGFAANPKRMVHWDIDRL